MNRESWGVEGGQFWNTVNLQHMAKAREREQASEKERNKERLADEENRKLGGGISQCILSGLTQTLEYGCGLILYSSP